MFVVSIFGREGSLQLEYAFDDRFRIQGVNAADAFEFIVELCFYLFVGVLEGGINGEVLMDGITFDAEFSAGTPKLESIFLEESEEGLFLGSVKGIEPGIGLQEACSLIYGVIGGIDWFRHRASEGLCLALMKVGIHKSCS